MESKLALRSRVRRRHRERGGLMAREPVMPVRRNPALAGTIPARAAPYFSQFDSIRNSVRAAYYGQQFCRARHPTWPVRLPCGCHHDHARAQDPARSARLRLAPVPGLGRRDGHALRPHSLDRAPGRRLRIPTGAQGTFRGPSTDRKGSNGERRHARRADRRRRGEVDAVDRAPGGSTGVSGP